ncbi:MAG: thioredoxin fold domain-containing protein [Gammaproteobacteria bacterium]|nr:thioredoxin fold domain-containing protein [Gammaproteobacteria bacterium]
MNKSITLAALTVLLSMAHLALAESGRWYSPGQVSRGDQLYQNNCASCHGVNAEATANWKQTDSNGKYPPPPLDGSAHTWHHSLESLKLTIRQGGVQIGGMMPAFEAKLNEGDMKAVIAHFQSKWPDQTYRLWAGRFEVADLDTSTDELTRLLRLRLGTDNITPPTETRIKGVYQTRFGNRFGYLIEDGRYVFIGELVDLERSQTLTELSRRDIAVDEIARISPSDTVIFPASDKQLAVLNVFTDTSCPYCQKLHEEVGYLQDAGISVHYFPYPRGSTRGPGYATLKQVWCADDRLEAMNIAKGVAQGALPSGDCASATFVDQGFIIGNRIGITGTPALFLENGTKIDGYRPYQQLIPLVLNGL